MKIIKQTVWNLLPQKVQKMYSYIRCPEHRPTKMTLGECYIYKDQEGADLIARTLEAMKALEGM